MRSPFLKTALQASLFVCISFLYSHVEAHEHEMHTSLPYKKIAGCEGVELRCANAATPYLSSTGVLWLVWTANGAVLISKSLDMGKTFAKPIEIARHNQYLDTGPDARPQLIVDAKGNILIAYTFFKDTHWNAQLNISRSTDGGQTFAHPLPLITHSPSQRFPALGSDSAGNIFIAWVDKRKKEKTSDHASGSSIAYTWSSDGGAHFLPERIANDQSCECCRLSVAMDEQKLPVLMYRAIFEGSIRDHGTQRFLNPTTPDTLKRVAVDNWKTESCPHHGPSLTVAPSGKMHVAWFTNGQARSGIFYANSTDKGLHYSAPRQIGNPDKNGGRPYVLALQKDVWLTWKEFDGHQTSIYLERSTDEGKTWSKTLASQTSGYSDHPLLIHAGNQVFLSWLTRENGYRLIKVSEQT
ncbi:MAG: sialidase family protein [Pseudomonadota bacterium]